MLVDTNTLYLGMVKILLAQTYHCIVCGIRRKPHKTVLEIDTELIISDICAHVESHNLKVGLIFQMNSRPCIMLCHKFLHCTKTRRALALYF